MVLNIVADPQAQGRKRVSYENCGLLEPQSLPLVTHLLQQGSTTNPSQVVSSTGSQVSKHMSPKGAHSRSNDSSS